ncbi:methyl-accepting chemotaxis protein [Mesobacillus foraminis]|uniref:methyl-accepting chemotaxis protein n=1 Tax=Mesobacillus foraminis TaxID=279826 RepID=UPI001BEBF532|nr:methyl-accepting chemotaxis protein [Mesobacillus foraminis]MBT2756939.1 methyl-accepting chemotaxis protein [Mesobacillus foraminis]
MVKKFVWSNLTIGRKYLFIFSLVALTFVGSLLFTYLMLTKTQGTMESSESRNAIASNVTELDSIYKEKYIQIPQYLILSDEKLLSDYLEDSKRFVEVAKMVKSDLKNEEQIALFNQMIENNHELDQYFFSTVVPKVKQLSTDDFKELQQSVEQLRADTSQVANKLKSEAVESNISGMKEAKENIDSTSLILIFAGAVSLIVSFVLLMLVSRKINRELNLVVSTSDEIANGNLNFTQLAYEGQDEIGRLSHSINHMGARLREMIYEVSRLAGEVDRHSSALAGASSEVKIGSEQISVTIEELASGASNQANEAASISESTEAFHRQLLDARENSTRLAGYSDDVQGVLEEGSRQMTQSLNQMNVINDVVRGSVVKIESLTSRISTITELVDVIKSISNQTNLLSLNASIEAARAGEAGRGFAVVAEEVRKLSEEVGSSVANITQIVGNILHESAVMKDELNKGFSEVNKGTEQIRKTDENFTVLKQTIDDMNINVKNISQVLQYFNQASEEINESVGSIAAITEESAAGAQEVSAAAIQQNHSIDSISHSAEELREMMNQMNDMINKFRL